MLVVRVDSLTGNVVAHLEKVPGKLTKTPNDQCNILKWTIPVKKVEPPFVPLANRLRTADNSTEEFTVIQP